MRTVVVANAATIPTVMTHSPEQFDDAIAGQAAAAVAALPNAAAKLRAVARVQRIPMTAISRATGLSYARVERILNGRFRARRAELEMIGYAIGVEVPGR